MENGRLGAILAIVFGFLVGYKWPKIKRQINPVYRKAVKQVKKQTRKGIQKTVKLFTGKTRKPALAKARA